MTEEKVLEAKWTDWAKVLGNMIKDQRGYTPEQFSAKFLELKELVKDAPSS